MNTSDYEIRPFPPSRHFVVGALRAGRRAAPMHGFLDLDVTDAMRSIDALDRSISFTAFVVAAVARAVAETEDLPEARDWWRAKASEYATLAEELGTLEGARETALTRARIVTVLGLVACSALVLVAGAMASKKMPP